MGAGADYEAMKKAVLDVVALHFRPEFINRVDDVVVFHALEREQIRSIADIQIGILRARLAERELALDLDESAMELLVEAGFDPAYGARPLKRAIQRLVENPLAQELLAGRFVAGDRILVTRGTGAALEFSSALGADAA
jgi:ATP-dependent Clp protease ATP-binding subunit ClpB